VHGRRVFLAVSLTGILAGTGVAAAASPAANAHPAPAVPAPAVTALHITAEAWYQLTGVNTCSLPTGCTDVPAPTTPDLPVNPTVYQADTLHVGWAGAVETARTYLKLARAKTTTGGTVLGATLKLPVLTAAQTGTLLYQSAGIKACLVTQPFTDGVEGATSAPPAIDCSVSNPLELGTDAFNLDLAPFLGAWAYARRTTALR